ncbi:glutathione S-transferase 1-1-like [Schistocerca serialis cubense]|uniref:glutathione S-transferase 1-1-like n=1 Tax=Schistocerca serialis cubense TaxID=2023355 RepID=UPI00214E999E|nr:glutathione S-transferase 1-1-like [Schistocerca serialis cubense]
MPPLTLYNSNLSVPCRLVRIVAGVVGVDLKIVNVVPRVDLRTPEWLKKNPQHTVPVVDDNGLWLNESRAISMYLISKYAKDDSLYPKDVNKRVLVDQRLFFDQDLFGRLAKIFHPQLFGKSFDPSDVEKVNDSFESLSRMLEDKQWLAGENITLADYAVATSLVAVEKTPKAAGVDHLKHANIKQWLSRFEDRYPQILEHRKGVREALEQRLQSMK